MTSVLESLVHLEHTSLGDMQNVHDTTDMAEVAIVFLYHYKKDHINNCSQAPHYRHRRRTSMTSNAMRKKLNVPTALCTDTKVAAINVAEHMLPASTQSSSFIKTATSRKCGYAKKDHLSSVVYLESYFEKAKMEDNDTVAYIDKKLLNLQKNRQHLIDTAFMSPGK